MQRYRVNLPLLISLVVGSVVLLGGSYGLYRYQKSRSADRLLTRVEAARASGDLRASSGLLIQYLRLRPGDEEAMVSLSETLMDIAESPKSEPVDVGSALSQAETTVRNFPERDVLRRRLVDLYMSPRVRDLKSSLDHISQLLNRSPEDPELEAMQSRCFFAAASPKAVDHAYRLIGYDRESEKFDLSQAVAPHEPEVYSRLARKLRSDFSNNELADRVIEQMVEVNPESGTALLYRGQYREALDGPEAAVEDIQQALILDPKEPRIVTANARLAMRDERFEEAQQLLRETIKENPTEPSFYLVLSQALASDGKTDEAIATCIEGIEAVPEDQWSALLVQQTQLQLRSENPEQAKETIRRMREIRAVPEAYPEYFEARLMVTTDTNWFEAAKIFDKYESFMTERNPAVAIELKLMLGLCREKLGQNELALAAYERALRLSPDNVMADLGRVRVRARVGGTGGDNAATSIYTRLEQELAKPEAEQDWVAFEQAAEDYVKRLRLNDAMLLVLKGEIAMRRGLYPRARKLLLDAYKQSPEDLGVRRAAVKLFAADPEQGPVKALKLLDKVIEDLGDKPILRLERADLLVRINPEDLSEQLMALSEDMEGWTNQEQVQVLQGLSARFGRMNDNQARAECLERITQIAPRDLAALLEYFRVALANNDEARIRETQDRILKVVQSKEEPTWLYTEARRLFTDWQLRGGVGDGLEKAEELIEKAISRRQEWHELHTLKAEIAVAKRDYQTALASYDLAVTLGRQEPRSFYQYVKLLSATRRYADALKQLNKVAREARLQLLGREYAEALLQTGDIHAAIAAAKDVSSAAPNMAATQLWTGRLLSRAASSSKLSKSEQKQLRLDAGEAYERAMQANSRMAEGWLALVGHYASIKNVVAAEDAVRRASLALDEDRSELLLARSYEVIGRGIDAEALYKQALQRAEGNQASRVKRLLAQFYLGGSYRGSDAVQKATPLINDLLRASAEGDLEKNDPNARWARSTAARLLARNGTYRELLDAEHLLSSNSLEGTLPVEDRLLMATILAPRPEHVSRLKAVGLLEEIAEDQQLTPPSLLQLGQLYYGLGDWENCRQTMIELIARQPEDIPTRTAYLEMLLQRGGAADLDTAVRQAKRLQKIAPNTLSTRDLLARIAHQKGRTREATKTMLSMLPRDASAVKPEQIPLLRQVAQRLVEFEQYQQAAKVYEIAANLGGPREKIEYAAFQGEHIDPKAGLDALEQLLREGDPTLVLARSLVVLRSFDAKGEVAPAELTERVSNWLDKSIREEPGLLSLKLQQAELYDIQKQYDKAAETYKKVLQEQDLTGQLRAVVLNNLAYLMALTNTDQDSAQAADRYIAEAVQLLGPRSDLLDTRAMISLAAGRAEQAVADLEFAVKDRPTASKYFHLAAAYMQAGKAERAAEAWSEALELGLSRESVSQLEREQYDRLEQQMSADGLTSVAR